MGWFWADPEPAVLSRAHIGANASPPPGCPMHRKPASTGACPYVPVERRKMERRTQTEEVDDNGEVVARPRSGLLGKLNPLNLMPADLSQARAPRQTLHLPTEREASSIPRGRAGSDGDSTGGGNWEYPSPQQMYNAMLRKGYTDTPQDAVESMVAVHNFLNEGAWAEIVEWERRFAPGIVHGWRASARGEEGCLVVDADDTEATATATATATTQPRLTRFMGRPGEPTPKARMLAFLGRVWPAKFSAEPPFDRHDWFVQRTLVGGRSVERRYVIDYYEGPPEHGMPVFYLDVRPAIDSPSQAAERAVRWGRDVWWRAVGGNLREQLQSQRDGEVPRR